MRTSFWNRYASSFEPLAEPKPASARGAVLVANILEARRGAVERLLPGGGPEMGPGIARIDGIVDVLAHTVPADHRLGEPLRIVNVVESEPAFHAQPAVIGRAVLAGHVKKLVVLDVVGELAADAAIGAHRIDFAIRIGGADVGVVDQRRRHQGAGRTGLHAFPAGDAGAGAHRIVEIEHDLFGVAAARHADDVVDLDFAAGADAKIALDAGVEIDRHRGMAAVGLRVTALGKASDRDAHAIGP